MDTNHNDMPGIRAPILMDGRFGSLLDIVKNKRCELIENPFGNWGDKLIHQGFLQLFERNSVHVTRSARISNNYVPRSDSDLILSYGGGNVGGFFPGSSGLRKQLRRITGIQKILLPQSAFDEKEDLSQFEYIFAREQTSFAIMNQMGNCLLAPDGALALDPISKYPHILPWLATPGEEATGLFLRTDRERPKRGTRESSICDPSKNLDFAQFIEAPRHFSRIVTNRLHFAIWSLLLNRRVILLENSYHKNKSLYETWLSDQKLTSFSARIKFSTMDEYARSDFGFYKL